MNTFVVISLAAVAIVLVLGLANVMKGGSSNASQTFMRWRVGLQFIAITVVMLALYLRG